MEKGSFMTMNGKIEQFISRLNTLRSESSCSKLDKEFAEFVKNNDSNTYNYVDMYFDFLSIDRGLK